MSFKKELSGISHEMFLLKQRFFHNLTVHSNGLMKFAFDSFENINVGLLQNQNQVKNVPKLDYDTEKASVE